MVAALGDDEPDDVELDERSWLGAVLLVPARTLGALKVGLGIAILHMKTFVLYP